MTYFFAVNILSISYELKEKRRGNVKFFVFYISCFVWIFNFYKFFGQFLLFLHFLVLGLGIYFIYILLLSWNKLYRPRDNLLNLNMISINLSEKKTTCDISEKYSHNTTCTLFLKCRETYDFWAGTYTCLPKGDFYHFSSFSLNKNISHDPFLINIMK